MGGPKKKSLAQMEKQQQLQAVKESKVAAKTGKGKVSEKTGMLSLREITEEDLSDLVKIKALTPFAIATKYNVRLSVAKEILEMLEKRKAVQQVASGKGLKIYKFIGNT